MRIVVRLIGKIEMDEIMKSKEKMKMDDSANFMLKEYDRLANLVLEENRECEKRVSFFIKIVSAAFGVILILLQLSTIDEGVLSIASIGIMTALLLIGFVILNRLNVRSVQHEAYIQMMVKIQDYFSQFNSDIANYVKGYREIFMQPKYEKQIIYIVSSMFRGNLSGLVIMINSLLVAGITLVAFLNTQRNFEAILFWSIFSFVASILLFDLIYRGLKKIQYPIW